MHFGTCKVPLHAFLRQGEQSKVTAQEYEIAENEYGLAVGGLQVLVANEGRKTVIADGVEKNKEVEKKHKKKVISKPLESIGGMAEGQQTLAMAYEYTKQGQTMAVQSEVARKKLRVERLKKQAAQQELS